jgi:hypothetical protein
LLLALVIAQVTGGHPLGSDGMLADRPLAVLGGPGASDAALLGLLRPGADLRPLDLAGFLGPGAALDPRAGLVGLDGAAAALDMAAALGCLLPGLHARRRALGSLLAWLGAAFGALRTGLGALRSGLGVLGALAALIALGLRLRLTVTLVPATLGGGRGGHGHRRDGSDQ